MFIAFRLYYRYFDQMVHFRLKDFVNLANLLK